MDLRVAHGLYIKTSENCFSRAYAIQKMREIIDKGTNYYIPPQLLLVREIMTAEGIRLSDNLKYSASNQDPRKGEFLYINPITKEGSLIKIVGTKSGSEKAPVIAIATRDLSSNFINFWSKIFKRASWGNPSFLHLS